jgi:hypothetical protein
MTTLTQIVAERTWTSRKGQPIQFLLLERTDHSTSDWQNLVLTARGNGLRKHNWHLAWNGRRLSNTKTRRP